MGISDVKASVNFLPFGEVQIYQIDQKKKSNFSHHRKSNGFMQPVHGGGGRGKVANPFRIQAGTAMASKRSPMALLLAVSLHRFYKLY